MSPCGGRDGCWNQSEVNVGWYGFRTTRWLNVSTAPGLDHGNTKGNLQDGDWVGIQSVRNPSASDTPAPRAAIDGYIWVYSPRLHLTGWVRLDGLEPFDNGQIWARGPAGKDFHVLKEPCNGPGGPIGCGGRNSDGRKRVIGSEDVYLRYAPQSTAFHYLAMNDQVIDLYRSPLHYACIAVLRSDWTPPGTRGWIIEKALKGEPA